MAGNLDVQGFFDYVAAWQYFWPLLTVLGAFATGLLIPWGRRSR